MHSARHNPRPEAHSSATQPTAIPDPSRAQLRLNALDRWDTEGGAGPDGPQSQPAADDLIDATLPLAPVELNQLRIRIIALENVLIAVLAEGSVRQTERAIEMATLIATRPGFTPHPLMIHAARHIQNLVERSGQVRALDPATGYVVCGRPDGKW